MSESGLLLDLVVVYGVGALVAFLFHKLRQTPLVGFLVTGMLVGPFGLSLVRDAEHVHVLAEIGVMLLLFSLGIEFSVKKLLQVRRVVFGAGPFQVLVTLVATMAVASYAGLPTRLAIFLGFLTAISSTAIVVKGLIEQGEVDSIHGKVSLGILIFQDLCVVPLVLVTPLLAQQASSWPEVMGAMGRALAIILAILLVSRYLSPMVLRAVVLTRNKELFVIASLWMLLVIALGVSAAGFSLALGAFLAGLVLSESEYAHQIFADMRPFRDGLNSLFFISIGMLVDPSFLWAHKGIVLIVIGAVLIGKATINFITVLAWGFPGPVAAMVGLGLAQIGEFSFVLLEAGYQSGLVTQDGYQIAISCAVATMGVTPALVWGSRHLASSSRFLSLSRSLSRKKRFRNLEAAASQLGDHTLICGFGVGGRSIARVLKANKIPYLVLELNALTVQQEKERGEPIYYGDCTDPDILARAGIEGSRVVVLSLSDPFATRQAVRTVRSLNPELVVLTRTHYAAEIDKLFDLGSDEVVADEFETSIELIARVLRLYNFPRNLVAAEIKSIREERYQMFRQQEITVPRFRLTGSLDVFFETYQVPSDSLLRGVSIAASQIRTKTGALVLGIVRESSGVANPGPEEVIRAGDLLFLSGTKPQLHKAEKLLGGFGSGREPTL